MIRKQETNETSHPRREYKSQVIRKFSKNGEVMSKNALFVSDRGTDPLCSGREYGTPLDTLHFYLFFKLKLERGCSFYAPCISLHYELTRFFSTLFYIF